MRYRAYIAVCLWLAGAAPWAAGQRLPDERALPDRAAARLPDERRLPGAFAGPGLALPGERELPVSRTADPPSPQPQPDEPESEQIWLRLAFPGHTAPIRALAFSRDASRLWSAGEDKEAHLWRWAPAASAWLHQGVARWDVARSALAGRIYALSASQGAIALGGARAYGNRGDILLFDPAEGRRLAVLGKAEQGHQETLASLAFNPAGDRLASADISGRVLLWIRDADTGLWSPQSLQAADDEAGRSLPASARSFFPLAWRDDQRLLLPVYLGAAEVRGKTYLQWELQEWNVADGSRRALRGGGKTVVHWDRVTAIAVADQGRRAFSADATGLVFEWDLSQEVVRGEARDRVALALAASPNGQRLLVGQDRDPASSLAAGRVEVWSTPREGPPQVLQQHTTSGPVLAVAVAADGRRGAYADGASLRLGELERPLADWTATAGLQPPAEVAFSAEDGAGQYRLAVTLPLGPSATNEEAAPRRVVFDPQSLQLGEYAEQTRWTSPDAHQGDWRLDTEPDESGRYWLRRGERRLASLPWTGPAFGPRAACWIPDSDGRPYAVAVNVSSDGVLQVLRLPPEGPPERTAEVIRRFRGHHSSVHAISLSADRRYLATASQDGSIGLWKVEGIDRLAASLHRWGAVFASTGEAVAATEVAEDGPLFHRDIRAGDQLTRLTWWDPAAQAMRQAVTAQDIQAVLDREDELMPTFYFRRDGSELPPFQMHSAWNATARLFVSPSDREWAFWTPRGYYDASFNGHKLFGWQINRSRDEDVEFFQAAQFRARLERPRVMSRLLREGSLAKALDAVAARSRRGTADIAALAASQPRVTILSPAADSPVQGRALTLRVRIDVPAGQQLAAPKAFANGVSAGRGRLTASEDLADDAVFSSRLEYEWTAPLPNDPTIRLQVLAATTSEAVAMAERTLARTEPAAGRKPRLLLVSAGVSQYRDAGVPRLDYAAGNAAAFAEAFSQSADSLYDIRQVVLQNEAVTGPMWRVLARQTAEKLREDVAPDDLIVFYLSGHGVRDELTEQYYYLGAEARFADVWAGKYQDCLSFEDFAAFADLPCRKLVILDTCHSGAVQELQQANLKSALRVLQEDLVLTLTASEGHEEAFEDPALGMGRFTHFLVRALRGGADLAGDRDGVVTLDEAIRYVQYQVPASSPSAAAQHPTFSPLELQRIIQLPLAVR